MTGVTVISDGVLLAVPGRVKICSAATRECTTDTNTVMYAQYSERLCQPIMGMFVHKDLHLWVMGTDCLNI